MPGFDGRTALSLAKDKRPDSAFLFVLRTIGEDAAIEAPQNGATDYVLKHRLMRLIPAVDRRCAKWSRAPSTSGSDESMRQSEHQVS